MLCLQNGPACEFGQKFTTLFKSCECEMNMEVSADGTQCVPKSDMLDRVKMFQSYRVKEIWTNKGDRSGETITIVRGNTTIEVTEDEDESVLDPLYNLGDRIIKGEVKENETYAFVYRRMSSSHGSKLLTLNSQAILCL